MRGKIGSPGVAVKRYYRKKIRRLAAPSPPSVARAAQVFFSPPATRHPNHYVLTVVALVISVIAIALTVAFAVD
jgi:hypothetical protein